MFSLIPYHKFSFFFFFNDTATTEIYTLSLHDALPISVNGEVWQDDAASQWLPTHRRALGYVFQEVAAALLRHGIGRQAARSEEHTSELQSRQYLVCRLLLEKKKTKQESHRAGHSSAAL